jgi:hypothetical protein
VRLLGGRVAALGSVVFTEVGARVLRRHHPRATLVVGVVFD